MNLDEENMKFGGNGGRDQGKTHTTCSVEQSIAYLNGIVDCVGTSSIVDLPQAKANLWHRITAVELNSRHFCSCV